MFWYSVYYYVFTIYISWIFYNYCSARAFIYHCNLAVASLFIIRLFEIPLYLSLKSNLFVVAEQQSGNQDLDGASRENIPRSNFGVCIIIISPKRGSLRRRRNDYYYDDDVAIMQTMIRLFSPLRIWKLQAAFAKRAVIERKRKGGGGGMGCDGERGEIVGRGTRISVCWHTRTTGRWRFRKSVFSRGEILCRVGLRSFLPRHS